MKRSAIPFLLSFLLLAAAGGPAMAASDGPYSMEVLVGGVPLDEIAARGTTYVEALRGKEYAVRLTNRTGRRVGVALAVDGLNSIDAGTTRAREARKWILGPHASIVIEGWQTGSGTARRFYFTDEANSYGEWLGRTENLGVVTAAFFRERRPEFVPMPVDAPRREKKAAAPSAAAGRAAEAEDFAATGIGREVEHRVRVVPFEAEAAAAATIAVRYEYRDALVRLGVLPSIDDALARRERARGFEDGPFAPDPYRR